MTTTVFYPNDWCQVSSGDAHWADALAGTGTSLEAFTTGDDMGVGYMDTATPTFHQTFLSFDTSSIPSDATIDSVKLTLALSSATWYQGSAPFMVEVRAVDWTTETQPYWGMPLEATILANFPGNPLVGSEDTYVDWFSYDDFRSWIKKDGTTEFSLITTDYYIDLRYRCSLYFYSPDYNSGEFKPKLEVTYNTGGPVGGLKHLYLDLAQCPTLAAIRESLASTPDLTYDESNYSFSPVLYDGRVYWYHRYAVATNFDNEYMLFSGEWADSIIGAEEDALVEYDSQYFRQETLNVCCGTLYRSESRYIEGTWTDKIAYLNAGTWTEISPPSVNMKIEWLGGNSDHSVVACTVDDYVHSQTRALKLTTDGGDNWTDITPSLPTNTDIDIVFVLDDDSVVVGRWDTAVGAYDVLRYESSEWSMLYENAHGFAVSEDGHGITAFHVNLGPPLASVFSGCTTDDYSWSLISGIESITTSGYHLSCNSAGTKALLTYVGSPIENYVMDANGETAIPNITDWDSWDGFMTADGELALTVCDSTVGTGFGLAYLGSYSTDESGVVDGTEQNLGIASAEAFGTLGLSAIPNTAIGYIEGPGGETIELNHGYYWLIEPTDFASAATSSTEVGNVQRELDLLTARSYSKLRTLQLSIRVKGDTATDVLRNVETLQRVVGSGQDWWLAIKPHYTSPNLTYFHIFRSPTFAVPYTRRLETHCEVDVTVQLNADPLAYGEETTLYTEQTVTTPGTLSLSALTGSLAVPLDVTLESATGISQAFVSLSEPGLFKELLVDDMYRFGTGGRDNTKAGRRSTTSGCVYSNNNWTTVVAWDGGAMTEQLDLTPGTYRVFARVTQDAANEVARIGVAPYPKPDSEGWSSTWGTRVPFHLFTLADGSMGWAWIEAGQWTQIPGKHFALWLIADTDIFVDSVVFMPTGVGFAGWNAGRWQGSLGALDDPTSPVRSYPPYFYWGGEISRRNSLGHGFTVTPGQSLEFGIIAANDTLARAQDYDVKVTVKYTPRYNLWVN